MPNKITDFFSKVKQKLTKKSVKYAGLRDEGSNFPNDKFGSNFAFEDTQYSGRRNDRY